MAKLTWKKEFGLSIIVAVGAILGFTLLPKLPLVSTLYGLGFMSMGVSGYITFGQALFGGVGALIASLLIAKWR